MVYTVGEMAKMLEVPASTLRYYDKEGLLPFVERSPGGMADVSGEGLRVAAGHRMSEEGGHAAAGHPGLH